MTDQAQKLKTLGNEAFSQKRYADAITFFTQAIEINENDQVFFSNRSACYASMGNWTSALEDADSCLKLNASFVKGYSRKGQALFNLGQYDEALSTYKEGLELEPTNKPCLDGLTQTESAMKQSEGSLPGMGGGMPQMNNQQQQF